MIRPFTSGVLLAALMLATAAVRGLAAPATSDTNFIASPTALRARIKSELNVTKPDFVVFVPRVTDTNVADTGNEHFLAFDGPDGSLMAVWITKASAWASPAPRVVSTWRSTPASPFARVAPSFGIPIGNSSSWAA